MSWGLKRDEIGEMHENWVFFPLVDRLPRADEEGGVRQRYGEIYREVSGKRRLTRESGGGAGRPIRPMS